MMFPVYNCIIFLVWMQYQFIWPLSGLELIPDRILAISWHGDSFTKCWPPDGCSRDLDGGETFSISHDGWWDSHEKILWLFHRTMTLLWLNHAVHISGRIFLAPCTGRSSASMIFNFVGKMISWIHEASQYENHIISKYMYMFTKPSNWLFSVFNSKHECLYNLEGFAPIHNWSVNKLWKVDMGWGTGLLPIVFWHTLWHIYRTVR